MSFAPIIWALEHAPVIDAAERAVLMALANKGDFDGCNAYRGYPSIAKIAKVDPKTVERKCHAMEKRGIIRRQPGPKPAGWVRLPGDKKTVVWEIMIPHSYFSAQQLANTNETRAERGRAPITPKNRPDLAPAPEKKARADKGKKRPKDPTEERGDSESPRPKESEGTTSPPATGLRIPPRGDYESPNLLIAPSSSPSPPAPSADIPQQRKEEKKNAFDEQATALILERLADAPGGPPTLEEIPRMLEHIRAQAAKKGTEIIHNMHTWVSGRHASVLLADLEHVRHHAGGRNGARPDVCGLHPGRKTLPCRPCTLAGKQGLVEYLEPELERVGAEARPDLAEAVAVARTRATAAA